MRLFQTCGLGLVLATGLMMAQPTSTTGTAKTSKTKMTTAAPTDAEISTAKAAGQVWCNTSSKACHDANDPLFGKTKHGEFVAPGDVASKGYHMAGQSKGMKGTKAKKTTATT